MKTKPNKNKPEMITTNIRLSKPDWVQAKTIAAQLGMSLNQYVTTVVINANKSKALNLSADRDVIWQLPEIGPPVNEYKPKKLSAEDQLIYEK